MLYCVLQPIRHKVKLPDPFPIPVFRGKTQQNFAKGILTDSDKRYIVQVLATVLMTYNQKPSLDDCKVVATALLATHPFLKDDVSDGEDGEVIAFFYYTLSVLICCM